MLAPIVSRAQNNIWSLPPYYGTWSGGILQQPIPLPTPGGNNSIPNYAGQFAEHSHAAMQDAGGNLLFFVVDGVVYNKDGVTFGPIMTSGGHLSNITGNSEVSIIPNPDNCQQYYIVFNVNLGAIANAASNNFPIYVTLDLSIKNHYTPAMNGNFLNQNGTTYEGQGNEYIAIDLRQGLTPSWRFIPKYKSVYIASSKLRTDGSRFLFVSNSETVWRYRVTGNGIAFDNSSFKVNNNDASGHGVGSRSEIELYEFNNGTYRMALPYRTGTGSTRVSIVDLNNTGSVIQSSRQVLDYHSGVATGGKVEIKGLEFSPNGNYLYLTHSTNSVHQEPFQVYNVSAQSFIPQNTFNPQFISQVADFKLSQIELSNENVHGGRMYLINGTGMSNIDNVDDPTNLTWNTAPQNFNYNLSTRGITIPPTSTNYSLPLYLLPDQIDGMDYAAHFNTAACSKLFTNEQYYICGGTNYPSICPTGANANTLWSYNTGTQMQLLHTGACYAPTQTGMYFLHNSISNSTATFEVIDTCAREPKCMIFDGNNDYLTSQTNALNNIGTRDFTFEAVINGKNNVQGHHPMIFSNKAVSLFFHNNWGGSSMRMLCLQLGGANYLIMDNGTFNANILDGKCHHVAVSRKGDYLLFYIDGHLIGERIISGNPSVSSNNKLSIGKYHSNAYFFKGSISQVRIWNVVRTQSQIAANTTSSLSNQTGLTAYFELADGNAQITDNKVDNFDAQLGSTINVDSNDPSWNQGCCNPTSNAPNKLKSENISNLETESISSNKIALEHNISIYPNPNNGVFEVSFKGIEEKISITIYNSIGKLIESKQVLNPRQLKFDLSQYNKGIYLIKIETAQQVISKRVVVE